MCQRTEQLLYIVLIRTDKRSDTHVLVWHVGGVMGLEYHVSMQYVAACRELLCSLRALCNQRGSYRSRQRHIIGQTRNQAFTDRPAHKLRGGGRSGGGRKLMIGRRRSLDTDTALDHLLSTVKLIARRRHQLPPSAIHSSASLS